MVPSEMKDIEMADKERYLLDLAVRIK